MKSCQFLHCSQPADEEEEYLTFSWRSRPEIRVPPDVFFLIKQGTEGFSQYWAHRLQAQSWTFAVLILRLLFYEVGEIYMFALLLCFRVTLFGDAKFKH